ncbi:hypothetical protein [Sorangium sp. So ce233]|uniref:hypothetical protein n=1 Tax=Sorangium sp. So ce233 TaxID=3133290 RepID=UPI003F6301A3
MDSIQIRDIPERNLANHELISECSAPMEHGSVRPSPIGGSAAYSCRGGLNFGLRSCDNVAWVMAGFLSLHDERRFSSGVVLGPTGCFSTARGRRARFAARIGDAIDVAEVA